MSQLEDGGTSVLANHPYADTGDAEAARRLVSALLIPHDLEVHRGLLPFRVVHRHAALDAVSFHYLRYEPEVTMTWAPPERFHLLTIPISGLCRPGPERRRVEIAPGQCAVLDATMASRLDLVGNCEALLVKIPSSEVSFHSAGSAIVFDQRRAVPEDACGALIDLVRWICRDLDHARPVSADPIAAERMETLLLDTVLSACRHDGSRPKVGPVPRNVRRCEEFIELHAADAISIADMTAVSGASERMLFQDFHDHRATSPMAFLKSVRLERAHADLVSANGGERTVSEVANAWRFAHAGQFARDYRGRFGRNPSVTLRGARDLGYPGVRDETVGG